MIIALSGIDGSGKSTQLDLLEADLARCGARPARLWYRPGYSRQLDALRRMVRRLRPGALPTASQGAARERAFAKRRVRWTWLAVAWCDAMVHYGAKVRGLDLAGYVVLCDRYLADAIIDLELRFPELDRLSEGVGRILSWVAPNPDVSIMLSLPYPEVERRLAAKDEPFPDRPEVRRQRYEAYRSLARRADYAVVDASAPTDAVHRRILDIVNTAAPGLCESPR
jgi:dTMP kinase